LMVCVAREHHAAILAEYPQLVSHPVLGKWLYLSRIRSLRLWRRSLRLWRASEIRGLASSRSGGSDDSEASLTSGS
jgi:hypothetical protein